MTKITQFMIIAGIVLVVGGGLFLMTWDIPAPSENVTKTLNNDRFPS